MTTIMPQSELLRRAAAHVSEALAERPDRDLTWLLDETAMRFNLGPREQQALERLFRTDKAAPRK